MTVYTADSMFARAKFKHGARIVYSSYGLSRMPGRVVEAPTQGKTYLVILDGDTWHRRANEAELDWETPRDKVVRPKED